MGWEGDDNLFGGGDNDTLNGGSGSDDLSGDGGDDILNGGAGRDFLKGREGNDTLNGGADNDTPIGVNKDLAAPGVNTIDLLTGGAGRDRFLLGNKSTRFYIDIQGNGSDDYAEIADFESGIDTIQFKGALGDYAIAFDGTDTSIRFGGDLVANVLGVNLDAANDLSFV